MPPRHPRASQSGVSERLSQCLSVCRSPWAGSSISPSPCSLQPGFLLHPARFTLLFPPPLPLPHGCQAMFAFLSPAVFPLPARAPPRSLPLHPPRAAPSRAKVSPCQVATCPAGGSGSAGATLQTSSRICAVSSLPGSQGSACSLPSLQPGMLRHIRGRFPLGGCRPTLSAAGQPAQTRLCSVPPFPGSLRVCWLPAPARRILFLPLR